MRAGGQRNQHIKVQIAQLAWLETAIFMNFGKDSA